MDYANRLIYRSNQWYNDGLKKANIRDMSGAILSLKKSLQFHRGNIAARNLLGLVYYGIGEVGEALVQWIISNNMKSHGNIARYYIKKLQEDSNELEAINQAIAKYNQALAYCEQGGEDLAVIQLKKVVNVHPTFLKAYQLLALLYIRTEQYANARHVLRKAHRLDKTSQITLTYMNEVALAYGRRENGATYDRQESISYNLGNETIIQPVSSTLKDNASMLTVLNIVIGIILGATTIWFLAVPSVKRNQALQNNKAIVQYSDQIAALKEETKILEEELAAYQAVEAETEEEKAKAKNTRSNYEKFVKAMGHYYDQNYSMDTLEKELLAVDESSLGKEGKAHYDAISSVVFAAQCEKLYESAQARYEVANFEWAAEELTRVVAMDEKYAEGKALLLLADSYRASGDKKKAQEKYQRVVKLFKDSEVATQAAKALEELSKNNAE